MFMNINKYVTICLFTLPQDNPPSRPYGGEVLAGVGWICPMGPGFASTKCRYGLRPVRDKYTSSPWGFLRQGLLSKQRRHKPTPGKLTPP